MYAIIDTENTGRMHGFSKVDVSTNNPRFKVVEVTEDELATIFKNAKDSGEILDGADASIDTAIDNPLTYRDYLILEGDKIVFDAGHTRENK